MVDGWKNKAQWEIDSHGVCDEYSGLIRRAKSRDAAIDIYKRGIDWSLENNAPSLDLLRENIDACERNGVFIDREFHGDVLNDESVYVFHNCRGTIRTGLNFGKRIIPMMYFANGCDMVIKSIPDDFRTRPDVVPLYVFGENTVCGENSESLVCNVYKKQTK